MRWLPCLLIATVACAPAADAPVNRSRGDAFAAPAGAEQLCAGHVTGAPQADGAPGPHITWTAYTSPETRETLVKRYDEFLGRELHRREGDCDIWRSPADAPTRFVQVCGADASGPWRDCDKVPSAHRSIIMISSMAK